MSPSLPELAVALEKQVHPAILLSPTYEVLAANTAYLRAFGGGAVGRRCHDVSHHFESPCDQHGESCPLAAARASRQPARVLHVHHTPRGLEHVDVRLEPVLGEGGEVVAYMEILRPVDTASVGRQVGRSRSFNAVLELAMRAAPSEVPVLLLGDSGTGKERMARTVHDASLRADGPFVGVACSGLAESLVESELFGHEKGAFTGAHARHIGLVEGAEGGTLFLDEIGDLPPQVQVKLLRLLESRSFRRVGGTQAIAADFRLVCATWRDLDEMVATGTFRRDLYFRISAFPIRLPALRERREDLPLLVASVLDELGVDKQLDRSAVACLETHSWPGNIRELRNVLQRAVLLADGPTLSAAHLGLPTCVAPSTAATSESSAWPWGNEVLPLEEVQRRYLAWCAETAACDRRELARLLGVSERTLYRKLAGS